MPYLEKTILFDQSKIKLKENYARNFMSLQCPGL